MDKIIIEIVKLRSDGWSTNRYETTKENASETMTNLKYSVVKLNNNFRHRDELQGMPIVGALCGPMWGGYRDGMVVIRYEDSRANDALSI